MCEPCHEYATPRVLASNPLLLRLDARSLPKLVDEKWERVAFLRELCRTPAVDGLWTWSAEPVGDDLPQTELRSRHSREDDRAVGIIGEPGYIGGVPMWSSHERLADESFELTGDEREWFVYYSTATKFHVNARRHFFVTADDQLLRELSGGRRQTYWQRNRVISVGVALALAGRAMRACELIYWEVDRGFPAASLSRDPGPLFKLTWSLRNTVMHGAGIGGMGFLRLDGISATESRIDAAEPQAAALDALAAQRGEEPGRWGVDRWVQRCMSSPRRSATATALSRGSRPASC